MSGGPGQAALLVRRDLPDDRGELQRLQAGAAGLPGFQAALTYARTVRIARIAEARERAVQVAMATGDWRAAVQDHLDERRRMATEEREDP